MPTELDVLRQVIGQMTPAQRQTLKYKARTAQSAQTQDALKGDVQRLWNGGEELKNDNGETAWDRAQRILQPNQKAKWKHDLDVARLGGQVAAKIPHMSPDEQNDALTKLTPSDDDPDYTVKMAARDKAEAVRAHFDKMREADPAQLVDGIPTLAIHGVPLKALPPADEVHGALQTNQNSGRLNLSQNEDGTVSYENDPNDPHEVQAAHQRIVDGRLAAQSRLGVQDPQPITQKEAFTLLQLPKNASPDEVEQHLNAAADKAEALYGPEYAHDVVKSAMGFYSKQRLNQDQRDAALSHIGTNAGPWPHMDTPEADKGGWFSSPEAETPNDPAMAERLQTNAAPVRGTPFDATKPTPNAHQIAWVHQDPKTRAPVFDSVFGGGAYADATQQANASHDGTPYSTYPLFAPPWPTDRTDQPSPPGVMPSNISPVDEGDFRENLEDQSSKPNEPRDRKPRR